MDMSTKRKITEFCKEILKEFTAQMQLDDNVLPENWLKEHFCKINTTDMNSFLSENDVKPASVVRYIVKRMVKTMNLREELQSRRSGAKPAKPGLDYYDNRMERGRSTSLQANMGQWNPNMLNA